MGREPRHHTSIVRLLHQLQSLHYAEAVLLVYHHQAQIFEFDSILNQGVGADHQLRVALRYVAAHFALAVLLEGAGQEHDAVSGSL